MKLKKVFQRNCYLSVIFYHIMVLYPVSLTPTRKGLEHLKRELTTSDDQSPIKMTTVNENGVVKLAKKEFQETKLDYIDESMMQTPTDDEEEEYFNQQLRVEQSHYNQSREIFVNLMNNLLTEVTNLSLHHPERAKEVVISRLEDEIFGIWPKIVSLSLLITDSNNYGSYEETTERMNSEYKYQEKLVYLRSKIHFLAKMRRCESPFETYFMAKNRCVSFEFQDSNGDVGNVCPVDQKLLDGADNLGVCACKNHHYSMVNLVDHRCYRQFTQGPCKRTSQWWVLKRDRNSGECQKKPDMNCPSDGEHVYWGLPTNNITQKRCYRLWEQGPCRKGSILIQLELIVTCTDGYLHDQLSQAPISKTKPNCPQNAKNCA